MTPKEKEKFKAKLKARFEEAYKRGGIHSIVTEMEIVAKEVDEGIL